MLESVKRKIWNYNRLRCDVRVRLSFIAPVYTSGLLQARYDPVPSLFTIPNQTTKDGIYLDLGSKDTDIIFDIPYFHYHPFYDLSSYPTVHNSCYLTISEIVPAVRVDDNSVLAIPIRIYVSLQNVTLDVPVPITYTSRVISKTLTSVSLAAKSLSNVPVIGMYASALSIGTSAAASIAHLFGFSRPIVPVRDHTSHSLMLGDIPANSGYLDTAASTVLNPVTNEPDPLTFKYLLQKPGMHSLNEWTQTNVTNDILFTINVSPLCAFSDGSYYEFTPLSYFYNMFEYWRGTIIYEFRFPSNAFVKGKLRAVIQYDLVGTYDVTSVPAFAFTTDMDLAEDNVFQIHVPYLSSEPYFNSHNSQLISTRLSSTNVPCKLFLQVVEPLVAPSPLFKQQIFVTTWAGEDFEFSRPTLEYKHYFQSDNWIDLFKSSIYDGATVENVVPDNAAIPTFPPIVGSTSTAYYTCKIVKFPHSSENRVEECVGERLLSVRPLLKTFDTYTRVYTSDTSSVRFLFPLYPQPACQLSTTSNYTEVTHIEYVSNCFVGQRGPTLQSYHLAMATAGRLIEATYGVAVGRPGKYKITNATLPGLPYVGTHMSTDCQSGINMRGLDVRYIGDQGAEIIQQVPFSSPYYYLQSATVPTGVTSDYNLMPVSYLQLYFNSVQTGIIGVKYAAGEDFNVLGWAGIPGLYRIVY